MPKGEARRVLLQAGALEAGRKELVVCAAPSGSGLVNELRAVGIPCTGGEMACLWERGSRSKVSGGVVVGAWGTAHGGGTKAAHQRPVHDS